jgi:2-oxoglutarate dehydrogenase E2 component (dihydrolipoamide succinyltransferase)
VAESEPASAYPEPTPLPTGGDSPYVTPLVRKLAAEHGVALENVTGTGVGGRIRKQDILEAARKQREAEAARAAQAAAAQAAPAAAPAGRAPAQLPAEVAALRGTTQRMSRPRQRGWWSRSRSRRSSPRSSRRT